MRFLLAGGLDMKKIVILFCLSMIFAWNIPAQGTDEVRTLPNYSPGHEQVNEAEDSPTLIISIAGIGSYEPHASGEQMFNQVQNMFGTKERKYDVSTINIYDITRQGGPKMTPESQQWEANKLIKDATATQSRHRIIRFQTQIPGIDDLVKANIKYFTPSVPLDNINSLAKRITDTVINTPENSSFKTRWEEETRRGAITVEAVIRKFKAENPSGKVILFGHSAGTDLIPLIPTVDMITGQRLIDLRVLSSPRANTLSSVPDPKHTMFVTHTSDFPVSPFGKLDDPRARGELETQGVVLEMQGGLSTNIPGFAQKEAHNKTFEYNNDTKMLIKTPAGNIDFTGKPEDIIRKVLDINSRPIIEGVSAPDQLKRTLDMEKSKASRVGGVTFDKPTEVPLDPNDIQELQFEYPFDTIITDTTAHSGYGFNFLMKSGEKISLPSINSPATAAEAFICVYKGFVPEVGYTFIKDSDGKYWKKVDYKNCREDLPFTSLGDILIEADHLSGDIAFAKPDAVKSPIFIKNYHNYNDLSFDNKLNNWDDPKQSSIIWLNPSLIRTRLFANRLEYEQIRMQYHFLSYDIKRESEFYAKTYDGYSDPAGDFLVDQLTNNFEDSLSMNSETVFIKETAGFTGVLLWAYNNNIHPSPSTWNAALRTLKIDRDAIMHSNNNVLRAYLDAQGKIQFVYKKPSEKPSKTNFNEITRPAPIFDQWGLSRLLWEDGSESVIEHNDNMKGRIEKLIGRQNDKDGKKDITTMLYDNDGRLIAIVDSKHNGVAVIWTNGMPILCRQVIVDLNSRKVVFNRNTQYDMVDDIEKVFGNMFATWLKAQAANQSTEAWLGSGESHWYDNISKRDLFYALIILIIILLLLWLIRWATGGMGGRIVIVLHQLKSSNPQVRGLAVEKLSKSKYPKIMEARVKILMKRVEAEKITNEKTKAEAEAKRVAIEKAEAQTKAEAEAKRVENERNAYYKKREEAIGLEITQLTEMIHNEDSEVRLQAIKALSNIDRKMAEEVVLNSLHDKNSKVRRHVIDLIPSWRMRKRDGIKPQTARTLFDHLKNMIHNEDINIRMDATEALGLTNDLLAFELLLEAFRDDEKKVRRFAASELTKYPYYKHITFSQLTNMFQDEDNEVRLIAVKKIMDKKYGPDEQRVKEFLNKQRVKEFLINALNDKDEKVIKKAADILHDHFSIWRPTKKMRRIIWAAGITYWPPLKPWYSRLGSLFLELVKSFTSSGPTLPGGFNHPIH